MNPLVEGLQHFAPQTSTRNNAVVQPGRGLRVICYRSGDAAALDETDQHLPHVDPSDGRRRYLDQAQLLCLAEVHQRVLVVPPGEPYAELVQRVEHLEKVLLSLLSLHKEALR